MVPHSYDASHIPPETRDRGNRHALPHRPCETRSTGALAGVLVGVLALSGCGVGTSSAGSTGTSGSAPSAASSELFSQKLHDQLPAEVLADGVLTFAGDVHPPYRTEELDGSWTGVDPEMQSALGAVLGVKTELVKVDGLTSALTGLESGRYDIFNGPVLATAERQTSFDIVTWTQQQVAYVIKADSGISSADDLCGKTVTYVKGSTIEGRLATLSQMCTDRGEESISQLPQADTNKSVLAVQSGRADAGGVNLTSAEDAVAQVGSDQLGYVVQTAAQGAPPDLQGMISTKASKLGPVLLAAMQELYADGTFDQIMDRHGQGEAKLDQAQLNPAK